MANNPAILLQQGIAAARAGYTEKARYLLRQVVEQDEDNVTAWLWLSGVVDNLDDKQVCLENVRDLDPGMMLYPTGEKEGLWWKVTDELGNEGWVPSTLFNLAK